MEQQFLTIWDLVLTPLYLLALVFIAIRYRDNKYPPGHPLRKYYLPGLYSKIGGAIFIGLLYAFYYKGGDTFNYFRHAQIINSALGDSIDRWLKLILHYSPDQSPEIYKYTSQLYWYDSPSEYMVAVITALLSILTFNTYLPTALLFAAISFTGIWAMYKTFAQLYPKNTASLAIAFLFIPSTVVWGSGIFKDTICMFGVGWITHATFRLFINKDFSVRNIFLIILSFILVAKIKLYILLAFLPALAMWLLLTYSKKIERPAMRWLTNAFFILLTVVGSVFFMQRFADELNKYSLEKITQTAKVTQDWTSLAAGEEGSVYNIGEISDDPASLIALFPKAVVVTFFRPFPWEAKKIIMVLSMIEALAFIYFTLQMFFNRKSKPVRTLIQDPNILFCLVFALIFGFAVGVSSGNFGTLSRYKIPCLPFYGAMLAIMLGEKKEGAENSPNKSSRRQYQPAI
ncbi:hypothetical protein [Flavisolibacter nicotianae]|uniref:hypothetical protein n=1 Tax=Flavisolibacter nicotianae TaxID=2364882 RepID=UPI0013C41B93|nr:hypothetical protein [Flavisolibacter nicotianae]